MILWYNLIGTKSIVTIIVCSSIKSRLTTASCLVILQDIQQEIVVLRRPPVRRSRFGNRCSSKLESNQKIGELPQMVDGEVHQMEMQQQAQTVMSPLPHAWQV